MKHIIKLFVFFVMAYLPIQSFAWGTNGHRIVGEIADGYLSAKAKAAIKEILGNESIAMCSNWADFIKSDTSMKYLDPWHYCDLEDGFTKESLKEWLKKDTAVDAYTKIQFITTELKKPSLTKEKKQFYLRLLVHIVGDIHQPMHVGRPSDLGGNRIRLSWFNEQTNLHSVWDDKLVEYQKLSYTEYAKAINFCTTAERTKWQQQPISDWMFESYEISRRIYAEVKPDMKLSYRYNYDHIAEVNGQLLKGGVRLAGLLNTLFA
jgi:hypothetical protein